SGDAAFALMTSNGGVASVTVTEGGSGYTSATTVNFDAAPAGGRTATGEATIQNGSVIGVTVTDPGSGYTSGPNVTFMDGGTGAKAYANAVIVRKSDTTDNTGLGDDHWKLVDANNTATFSTADEMAVRLAQVLVPSDITNALKYNSSDKTLTFTVDLN